MKISKFALLFIVLLPLLGNCAPVDPPQPDVEVEDEGDGKDEDEDETEQQLVLKVTLDCGEALKGKGLDFTQGDQIGVYCLNDEGTDYYNVCFSTEDGKNFMASGGRYIYYDENSKIYAYYPYVKDATKSLVKDIAIPLQQNGTEDLKSQLFLVARGQVVENVAELGFAPVQSVLGLKLTNNTQKEISLNEIKLEFDSYAAGIFRHNLENDPASNDFTVEPMSGTLSYNVELSKDSPYILASGQEVELNVLVAPMPSSVVVLKGYAGDGDWWSTDIKVDAGLLSGKLTALEGSITDDCYTFDVQAMIADMNLLEDSDYTVPDKHYKKRMLYPGGVLNCRDLGGIPLEDGGTTASGVIFRSAALEGVTSEGKQYMVETLGIKTDIDLRDSSTGEAKGYSPLGEDIYYFNRLGPWYALGADGIKEGSRRQNLLEILQKFADKRNYPLVFHCQVGRDRAGTVAAVLECLAGVTMKGLYEDYLISFYASCCHGGIYYASGQVHNIIQMYEFLSTYKSADLSLSENTEEFLLDLGLTQLQVDTIRQILLTGDISVSESVNPVFKEGGSIEGITESELE